MVSAIFTVLPLVGITLLTTSMMAGLARAGCVSDSSVTSGSPPLASSTCFAILQGSNLLGKDPHDRCSDLGGDPGLGSIHSSVENVYLQTLAVQAGVSYVELGTYASTDYSNGAMVFSWDWYDGSATDYQNFPNGSPSSSGYVVLSALTGSWSTTNSFTEAYLCRIQGVTPAPTPATPAPTPVPATTTAAQTTTTTTVAPTTTNASTTTPPPTTTTNTPVALNTTTTVAPTNWTATVVTNMTATTNWTWTTTLLNTTAAPPNTTTAPWTLSFNTTANFTLAPPNTTTAPITTTPAPTQRSYSTKDCVTLVAMSPPPRVAVLSRFDVLPQSQNLSPLHATLVGLVNASQGPARQNLQALQIAITGATDCTNIRASAWVPLMCDDNTTCGIPTGVDWTTYGGRQLTVCVAPTAASLDAAGRATSKCNMTDVTANWTTVNGTIAPAQLATMINVVSIPSLVPVAVAVAADVLDNPFRDRAAAIRVNAVDGTAVASLPAITSSTCGNMAAVVTFSTSGGDLSFVASREAVFSLQNPTTGTCDDSATPLTFLAVSGSNLTLGIPCTVATSIAVEPSVTRLCVALPGLSSAPSPLAQVWVSRGPTVAFDQRSLALYARGSEVASDVVVSFDVTGTLQQPTVNFITCDYSDAVNAPTSTIATPDCTSSVATQGLPVRQWATAPVVVFGASGRASFTLKSDTQLMRPTSRQVCVCFSVARDVGVQYSVVPSTQFQIQVVAAPISAITAGPDIGLSSVDPTLVVLPMWYTGNVTVSGAPGLALLLEGQSIVLCAAPTVVVVPRLYALVDNSTLMGYVDPSLFVYAGTSTVLQISDSTRQIPASLCLIPVNRPGFGAPTGTTFSLIVRRVAFQADLGTITDAGLNRITFTSPFGIAAPPAASTQIDAPVPTLVSTMDEVIALTTEVQNSVLFPNATAMLGAGYLNAQCRPVDRVTSYYVMAPPTFAPARVDLFPWDVAGVPLSVQPLVWCLAPGTVTKASSITVKPVRVPSGVNFTVYRSGSAIPAPTSSSLVASLSDASTTYANTTTTVTVAPGNSAAVAFTGGSALDQRPWWAVSALGVVSLPLVSLSDGSRVLFIPPRITQSISANQTFTLQNAPGTPSSSATTTITVSPTGSATAMTAPSAFVCSQVDQLTILNAFSSTPAAVSSSTANSLFVAPNATYALLVSSSVGANLQGCTYRLSTFTDGSCIADGLLDVGPGGQTVLSTWTLGRGGPISLCSIMSSGLWAPVSAISINITAVPPSTARRPNGDTQAGYAFPLPIGALNARYWLDANGAFLSQQYIFTVPSGSPCSAVSQVLGSGLIDIYNSVTLPATAFSDPAPATCIGPAPGSPYAVSVPSIILWSAPPLPDLRSRMSSPTHVLRVTAGGNGLVVVPVSVPLPDFASVAIVNPAVSCASLSSATAAQSVGFGVSRVLNNRFTFVTGVAPYSVTVAPNVSRAQLCVSIGDSSMHVVPLDIYVASVDALPPTTNVMIASRMNRDFPIALSSMVAVIAQTTHALLVPLDNDATRAPCDASRVTGSLASHRPRQLAYSTDPTLAILSVDGGALSAGASYRICLSFSDGHDPTDMGPVVASSGAIQFVDGVLYDTQITVLSNATFDWSAVSATVTAGFVSQDVYSALVEVQLSTPMPVGLMLRGQVGYSGDVAGSQRTTGTGATVQSMAQFVTRDLPFVLPVCIVSTPLTVHCTVQGYMPGTGPTAGIAMAWGNTTWIVVDGIGSHGIVIVPEQAFIAFYNPSFAPPTAWPHLHALELGFSNARPAPTPLLCLGCMAAGITVTRLASSTRLGPVPLGTRVSWRTAAGDVVDTRVAIRLSVAGDVVEVGLPRSQYITSVTTAMLGTSGITVSLTPLSALASTTVDAVLDASPSAQAYAASTQVTWWGATTDGWDTPLLTTPANWQPNADGTASTPVPLLLGVASNSSDARTCSPYIALAAPPATVWPRTVAYTGTSVVNASASGNGRLCTAFAAASPVWSFVAGPSQAPVTLLRRALELNAADFMPVIDVTLGDVFNFSTTSNPLPQIVLTDVAGPITQIALFASGGTTPLLCDPTLLTYVSSVVVTPSSSFPTVALPPTWTSVAAGTTNTLLCATASPVIGITNASAWSPVNFKLSFGAPTTTTTIHSDSLALAVWFATQTVANASTTLKTVLCTQIAKSASSSQCASGVLVQRLLDFPNAVTVVVTDAVFGTTPSAAQNSLVTLYNLIVATNSVPDATAAVGFTAALGVPLPGLPMRAAGTGVPVTTAPTKSPSTPDSSYSGMTYFVAFLCVVLPGTLFVIFRAWSEKNRTPAVVTPVVVAAPMGTIEVGDTKPPKKQTSIASLHASRSGSPKAAGNAAASSPTTKGETSSPLGVPRAASSLNVTGSKPQSPIVTNQTAAPLPEAPKPRVPSPVNAAPTQPPSRDTATPTVPASESAVATVAAPESPHSPSPPPRRPGSDDAIPLVEPRATLPPAVPIVVVTDSNAADDPLYGNDDE